MKINDYKCILVLGDSYSTGYEMMDHIIMTPEELDLWLNASNEVAWRTRAEACKRYYTETTGKTPVKNSTESQYLDFLRESINFVCDQEKQFSWPTLFNFKIPDTKVINLAEAGNSYYSNVQLLKNFLERNRFDKFLLINQIPSHWRIPIWLIGNCEHKDIGKNSLLNDTLMYKIKLWIKNKYKNNEELQYIRQYKKAINLDKFDSYMEWSHRQFLLLQQEYNFDCYYITGQTTTARFLQDKFQIPKKTFIKENLYSWGMKDFRSGRTHPKDLKYATKVIELIWSKFQSDRLVDTS